MTQILHRAAQVRTVVVRDAGQIAERAGLTMGGLGGHGDGRGVDVRRQLAPQRQPAARHPKSDLREVSSQRVGEGAP